MVLLTICSASPGVERWANTALKSGTVPVILMYTPHFDVPQGVAVRRMNEPYPGNVKRFFKVPPIVRALGEDRWYIWTDACDVVIQDKLPNLHELPGDVCILPCPEDITHGESNWKPLLTGRLAVLEDKMIYNGGLFAMRGRTLIEFVEYLRDFALAEKDGIVASADQLILNLFIQERLDSMRVLDGVFLCLDATYVGKGWAKGLPSEFNPAIQRDHRGFIHPNGNPYSIVHGNGTTKELL